MYYCFFKRFLDFVLSLTGFIVLSPVFIIVTILLFFANKGKPFFTQLRPGKNEIIFKIIKFKTMNDKRDAQGNLFPSISRITPIGTFIRKTSLDEIPQLINVIKGDMSLVGPRPLRIEYLPFYTDEQRKRHEIKPGITGWAQVNGRNSLSWDRKIELDVFYVNNVCFVLDVKILFLTIKKVLKRESINLDNEQTMTPFGGVRLNS
jgi:lipopolysaccharide/colanic/teichoic acid biosynthesis glycosyltransferase